MSTTDFAIVIGISRYPKLQKDLEGPVKDAEQFYDWLLNVAQLPKPHIKLVVSQEPPDPGTRPIGEDIDDAFTEVFTAARDLQSHYQQTRRLYLYFAGHGCTQEINQVMVLMANASLEELNRSLDMESYHKGLARRALFSEQVIFYDCCRNWDHRVQGRIAPWTKDQPTPGAPTVTQFILYAAGFTEYANERALDYSTRRGLFTQALMEGLNGRAVKKVGEEWVVSTEKLVPYVMGRLEELAKVFGLRQQLGWNPVGRPSIDLDLAKVATPGLFPLYVTTHSSGTAIVVKDDHFQEFQRKTLSEHQISFDLPPSLYYVCIEPEGPGRIVEVGPGKPSTITL